MQLEREWLEDLIFGEPFDHTSDEAPPPSGEGARRFTQDSPVLPDVWIEFGLAYCREEDPTLELLLTPHRDVTTAELAAALSVALKRERESTAWKKRRKTRTVEPPRIAFNQAAVAVRVYFDELLRVLLPLTKWWEDRVQPRIDAWQEAQRPRLRKEVHEGIDRVSKGQKLDSDWSADVLWMIRLVGVLLLAREAASRAARKNAANTTPESAAAREKRLQVIVKDKVGQTNAVIDLMQPWPKPSPRPPLWLVSRNRPARTAIWRSTLAVKADAARGLFNITCAKLAWAVIDSGIDARHPAFRQREGDGTLKQIPPKGDWTRLTRVLATYDFTKVRDLLNPDPDVDLVLPAHARGLAKTAKELRRGLQSGRSLDWGLVEPLLRVHHDEGYPEMRHAHGTHVAGILAGDWRVNEDGATWTSREEDLIGVCPDLRIYDLRVLDSRGAGDEFNVMAALQFIRYLNSHREQAIIHGANLSLSIPHDVANYACGRTPVCEECERVTASGVLVVAAAGNDGYMQYATPRGSVQGYRSISISDPGNTEDVITVGATHRYQPHTYGVSYFSSRGPTGDGRLKPDLVAPGEKIKAPVPGKGADTKDGTSMAAPHVSGAAALLMARHRELQGSPRRIKKILCDTATDLGRERYFQGFGMVDVLRALQSV